MKLSKSKRLNHYIKLACLTGALFCYSASAYAEVMPNTQLPQGGQWILGGGSNLTPPASGNSMTITQDQANAIIKWSGKYGFSIGSIASVEFKYNDKDKFNVLNYDASGAMSQIRGTLKAENGNVFIVNPAGVFIGNSAQVDVGSLYVSNKKIDVLDKENPTVDNISDMKTWVDSNSAPATAAELMSLGHINAGKVEFVGDRIVLDTELLTTGGIGHDMAAADIHIKTNDKNNLVIGYDAYNSEKDADDNVIGYKDLSNSKDNKIAQISVSNSSETPLTKADGYMWVRDLEQLQAMNTNLDGNYALRNGIGAISTTTGNFTPIGTKDDPFTGKLDGLAGNVDGIDFAIFDLNVKGNSNLGLFGVTDGAEIRNVLLTGGSITGTGNDIGALVGLAQNTTIENVRNSINVTGGNNVGGIVGKVEDINGKSATTISDILNTGNVDGSSNVGGIVGSIAGTNNNYAEINNAENLGRVQGNNNGTNYSHDIGGIAGFAKYADISKVENNLKIEGGYNVGGIVGSGENVEITGAVNNADVTATGYTSEKYNYHSDNYDNGNWINNQNFTEDSKPDVNIANIGGIIGKVENSVVGDKDNNSEVINCGNVKTLTKATGNDTYYIAGNAGGIAGRAENTNIYNVENKENEIFGAHNVGGIVGYFGSSSIDNAGFVVDGVVNNGGEVLATGARIVKTNEFGNITEDRYVKEIIRKITSGDAAKDESVTIGNIGGIVGYMYGDNTYIKGSANRGNVHSFEDFTDNTVPESAKAANVGGVVGKIDRNNYDERQLNINTVLDNIKKGNNNYIAAVSDSYNAGEVHGYTGIGGIAGMMYNGEITKSYNLGSLRSSYQATDNSANASYAALNLGGIVGDTTEEGNARAILYDVYNKGTIGSIDYKYYGRHVGGVVGRFSGIMDKAYNNGAIYNASASTGGVAGWWYIGTITNVFNTGNITVNHKTGESSRVGGIAGSVSGKQITLTNAYNLGILRSFINSSNGTNLISGIIGGRNNFSNDMTISNVYTMGNIYAGTVNNNGVTNDDNAVHAIIGSNPGVNIDKAYYIAPNDTNTFVNIAQGDTRLDGATRIEYNVRYDSSNYSGLNFGTQPAGDTDNSYISDWNNGDWRMYTFKDANGNVTGTMPILNDFVSSAAKSKWTLDAGYDVQYGNAYDPLLTIITKKTDSTNTNITLNWSDMGLGRNESLAVLNSGLTLNNFANASNKTYYGGLIFADGALTINGKANTDIRFSQAADIYGSSVSIYAQNGDILDYGNITAHGKQGDNSITISGNNVEILGETKALKAGESVNVSIQKSATPLTFENNTVNNASEEMPDYATAYTYKVAPAANSNITGDINVEATGDLEVRFGQRKNGLLSSNGSITLTGGKSVYVDSDIQLTKDLTIDAPESVLDLTNIGAVQIDRTDYGTDDGVAAYNAARENARINFVQHFKDNQLSYTQGIDNAMITMDLWDNDSFKLDTHKALGQALRNDMKVNGETAGFDLFHIWIDDAAALQGIHNDIGQYGTGENALDILTYNFALKNDIDAAEIGTFTAIGADTNNDNVNDTKVFSGKFNGRGNTIVGLDVDNNSAGLFSVIGTAIVDKKEQVGEVSNLNIYSSSFKGGTVGAVAGINKGKIDNVTTFGNRVNSNKIVDADKIANTNFGVSGGISSAGGIAGINNGTISNANVNDAVATTVAKTGTETSYAGGIAGVNTATGNNQAKIDNSVANSDVTSTKGAHALGGIVAINSGNAVLDTVRNLGIVNGTYSVDGSFISDNVGGIAGINEKGAQITKAYNVAQVSGGENVGGIVGNLKGNNTDVYSGDTPEANKKYDLQEVVSAGDIVSSGTKAKNVGGIVGSITNNNTYTYINSGRNTGEVTGNENVGGIVGVNGSQSHMNNIINDANATIKGKNNVGGLAGTNAGKIAASDMGLVNEGRVYGQTNVGGVVGVNEAGGLINNTNSNITLYVADKNMDAKYFGGVAGRNEGTITSATNTGSVLAKGAEYVGGIVGVNGTLNDNDKFEAGQSKITGAGNSNSGKVVGAKYVGGVAGLNVGSVSGTETDGITTIENKGIVIADNGAGGVFGENRKDINDAVLKNSGIVVGNTTDGTGGTGGTGGIIGLNSGNINNSDLINTVDGLVVGMENVGGLIGINKGIVKGGRDTEGNYYAHQVYNNGTVIGGHGTDVKTAKDDLDNWKSKTITDADGNKSTIWYQMDMKSHDIGGLIGSNSKDTDNNKTGSLTAGYNTGVVEGGTNVGGVVGNNAANAKVDQVFNAGAVTGTAENKVVGTVVGNNAGTVTNAYDTKQGVSDNVGNGQTVGGGNNVTESVGVWTTYGDGKSYGANKLLSVFLTKINFVPEYENAFKDFVYNAHLQNIIVKAVENGTDDNGNKLYVVNVYKNDGVTKEADGKDKLTLLGHFVNASNGEIVDENAAHSLADFVNSKLDDDTNVLLEGNTLKKDGSTVTDAGTYRIFNTQQINVVEGNHNNLGFDITDIKVTKDGGKPNPDDPKLPDTLTVDKAKISLTLDDVYRIYGDAAIDNKTVAVFNHIFGDKGNKDYGFTINGNNVTMNQKLVDELMNGVLKHSIKADGAVDNLAEGKTTNDVDTYDWSLQAILDNNNNLSANYELVGDNGGVYTGIGKSHVDKAELTITVDDKSIQVGEKEPAYTGQFSGLTNGDTEETLKLGYDLDGDFDSSAKKVYEDKIGVLIGNNGGVYLDKNSIENILKNYKVTIDPGTLTVTDSGTKPDPDPGPGPDNPHNWQAEDKYPWYQWDKQRHERERKAEVHFVDGGMRVEA